MGRDRYRSPQAWLNLGPMIVVTAALAVTSAPIACSGGSKSDPLPARRNSGRVR